VPSAPPQDLQEKLLKGYDDCCGVELPFCTYLIGGARVCHFRINKGDHMLKIHQKMGLLNVSMHDVWWWNIGLW
jgi:hypothetical protein